MRQARPGDQIVSYANGKISHYGTIYGLPLSAPKPNEFKGAGKNWSNDGWYVPVVWEKITVPFRPKDHIKKIASLLPSKYSPIQKNGNGNQGAYLTKIDISLFDQLMHLGKTKPVIRNNIELLNEDEIICTIEDSIQKNIENDKNLSDTEVVSLVKSRKGQGKFRANVENNEIECRVPYI